MYYIGYRNWGTRSQDDATFVNYRDMIKWMAKEPNGSFAAVYVDDRGIKSPLDSNEIVRDVITYLNSQ